MKSGRAAGPQKKYPACQEPWRVSDGHWRPRAKWRWLVIGLAMLAVGAMGCSSQDPSSQDPSSQDPEQGNGPVRQTPAQETQTDNAPQIDPTQTTPNQTTPNQTTPNQTTPEVPVEPTALAPRKNEPVGAAHKAYTPPTTVRELQEEPRPRSLTWLLSRSLPRTARPTTGWRPYVRGWAGARKPSST